MELVWRKQSSWAFRSIDCELLSCWQFWFIKWIQHKHLLTENYAFSAEIVFHFFTSRRHFLMLFSIPPRSFYPTMPIKNPITGSTNMKSLMKEKKRNHDIWLLNPQLISEWWWTNQIVHKVGQKFGLLNE